MIEASPIVENVLNKLFSPKQSADGWKAKCPAHDDKTPSLQIGEGKDGRALLHCHRGCAFEDIVAALGMTPSELMPVKQVGKLTMQETYPYYDEHGELLFEVCRYVDEGGTKTFRQRTPDGKGDWSYSTKGVRKPLFNLPAVIKAVADGKTVWIAEGEKDVKALEELGFVATCNPGGAGKWTEEHTATLAGNKVIVCADNDQPGKLHAATIVHELEATGSTVVALLAPGKFKDVAQAVGAGQRIEDMVPFDTKPIWNFIELKQTMEDIYRGDLAPEKKLAAVERAMEYLAVDVKTIPTVRSWGQFLDSDVAAQQFIIPHLLCKQERVILVAPEGTGKSMLSRQIALAAAVGIHPFTKSKMPPIRTLYVDLENPDHIIHKNSQNMKNAIRGFRPENAHLLDQNAFLVTIPSGLDLLDTHDQIVLERLVEKNNPDLLVLGPLYKAYLDPGGMTAEAVAGKVARFLDHLRETYDTALWLEHHAPLGSGGARELRPFGSSVWSRWSEFGLTLEADAALPGHYVMGHYRGMRDEDREFPKALMRGQKWAFDLPA